MAERAAADGNSAVAMTDHGNCAGHPEFQRECDKIGVKPVFGMEAYFIDGDRTERPAAGDKEAQSRLRANRHLVLLAQDDQGLHDLWALSTEASRSGFYHKPRADWDLLEQYGGHLVATSACLGGILSRDLMEGRDDDALRKLNRLKSIFGDRFYLELQGNLLPEQARLNRMLTVAGGMLSIPLVAAADSHYTSHDKAGLHKLWMSCATSRANDDYWHYTGMQAEPEVRQALSYLSPETVEEAVRNAALIAEQCNARISGHADPPVFTPGGTAADDARQLMALCGENWESVPMRGGTPRDYLDRFEREWRLVASKGLAGCYLIVHDIFRWCRSQGILIGPGRGSAAGSLMSYILGITAMDPLPYRLLFERFLTEGRTALPDFDMDFPSSKRQVIQDYVIARYGEKRVVRVGTAMRYRSKGILNKLFSVLADDLPPDSHADSRLIAGIIDEAEAHTAGLGLSWDDLAEQAAGYLAPFAEKYPRVFQAAAQLAGRLNSYGTHPAGLVISTSADLIDQIPMRAGGSGQMISQWDFRDLEAQGALKLDFLTLRTLDSVQETIDLVGQRWGVRLDPFRWDAEYGDPEVWREIGTGNTLGMFQVETRLGQVTSRRMKPRSVADLADMVALVRPGPANSGMAARYFRRRAGKEDAEFPHPLLAESLAQTQGVMLYQEDILAACRILAGYDTAEADEVRKILGKKKMDLIEAAGGKFVSRCREREISDMDSIPALWEQMSEFGRYAFNRSHATSYAILSFWTAWLKAHYPVETFAGILSTLSEKDKDRIGPLVTDARRLGVRVLPPDVNACASGFQPEGLGVRYGLDAIKGVGPAAVASISRGQPYASYEDFVTRSGADSGVLWLLAQGGALDAMVPSRRGLVTMLEADRAGESTRCVHKDERADGPGGLPCTFDWGSEPVPVRAGKNGRELPQRPKPLPRKCTRACRNYTPPSLPAMSSVPEYSPGRIWQIENEIFGCWLSDGLFARLDEMSPGFRRQARDIALRLPYLRPGTYPLAAVMDGIHEARTKRGGTMHWLRLATEVSYVDLAVFRPRGGDEPDFLPVLRRIPDGTLVMAEVIKGRYWSGSEWRDSWQLAAIEHIGSS